MKITLLDVFGAGDDRLLIHAHAEGVLDDDGKPKLLSAQGWLSALDNHFDEKSIDPETGQRKADAVPRQLTAAEKKEYCLARIREAYPELAEPKKVRL